MTNLSNFKYLTTSSRGKEYSHIKFVISGITEIFEKELYNVVINDNQVIGKFDFEGIEITLIHELKSNPKLKSNCKFIGQTIIKVKDEIIFQGE